MIALPSGPLAGIATTALVFVLTVSCTGGEQHRLTLSEWAEQFCAGSEKLQTAMLAVPTGADPNTLSLAQRVDQFRHVAPLVIEASNEAARELEAMEPPTEAAAYHQATIDVHHATAEFTQDTVVAWGTATTLDDLDTANAELRAAYAEPFTRFGEAIANVDPVVSNALLRVERCGAITLEAGRGGPQ